MVDKVSGLASGALHAAHSNGYPWFVQENRSARDVAQGWTHENVLHFLDSLPSDAQPEEHYTEEDEEKVEVVVT